MFGFGVKRMGAKRFGSLREKILSSLFDIRDGQTVVTRRLGRCGLALKNLKNQARLASSGPTLDVCGIVLLLTHDRCAPGR